MCRRCGKKGECLCTRESHNSSVPLCVPEIDSPVRRERRLWLVLKLFTSSVPLWSKSYSKAVLFTFLSLNGTPQKTCSLRSDWWEPARQCGGWTPVSVPLLGEIWTPGVSTTTIMGCNLCTLQKREEHYKLLYEIAQVSMDMIVGILYVWSCFGELLSHCFIKPCVRFF